MKYSDHEGLETMRLATRYKAYLTSLIGNTIDTHGTVLDFGAGMGTFATELKARAINVHCLEPDEDLAKVLEADGHHVIQNLDGAGQDVYSLIYSLNVLEHIEDDAATLRALHRCLAPGGTLLVYVPAFQYLYSSMDANVGHVRRYGRRHLHLLLENSGFEIINIRFADSLGFFATLLFKWFSRSDGYLSPRSLVAYDRLIFPLNRILDRLGAQYLFGKNVVATAKRR